MKTLFPPQGHHCGIDKAVFFLLIDGVSNTIGEPLRISGEMKKVIWKATACHLLTVLRTETINYSHKIVYCLCRELVGGLSNHFYNYK